jgi:hypothetical protein
VDESDDALTYPYAVTLDEVLEIVIEHLEIVRNTDGLLKQGVHLKMASRAMRCALEVYGSQLEVLNREKQ